MRILILLLLLWGGTVLAGEATIMLRIERGTSADSVLAVARRIEPRLGQIEIYQEVTGARLVGYRADSLADTLRFAPLIGPGVGLFWSADSTN